MQTRTLGHSGLTVSVVGLGCNNFGGRLDQAGTTAVVRRALDAGITLFDTADIYGNRGGSEELLGRALGAERANIVLASKFGMDMGDGKGGARPAYIREALHASLRRLGTDHLDLYQLHTPDPETPIEDTLGTLNDLVQEGLVRAIGVSNMPAADVRAADALARQRGWARFTSCQDEHSLLVRDVETDLIPATRDLNLGLLPYFPLASGLLTGKYRAGADLPAGARITGSQGAQDRYLTERNWAVVEDLRAFAEGRGHTLLDLAFSWLLSFDVTSSVIAGATKPEQIDANVGAASWILTPEELAEVDRITTR
ncbi:aldo/keto reductase [Deinococcus soli (ex Cha et al. 2016)]|uniref:Aryl-alcohol dehydrogenase-like predicted oxidoreductase n=2 Tax=Deinococcus soli (ex Cha et al. 2016) TaxID=1309411 RepID=A0AAE3X9C0_9DEIO|nr:aldo/keto reductase [Deinococcus soli (ex Cha et al. 2016)]MDR6216803.1 aryl-alcohol dehydrogenase-like predicted oxidoreductase [Deinococcus soli (ex Cha et al. 2016)]MDR6327624.1 aryl-alcohol dehydrogenase-like predicted oxidoreductase [Deinococcus soli (ex Cha et al. 2016)]MDR6749899.1 aryl-alcohol dehydrogenase-like predicted oxidoreductase [Deinococcus soli (ex Cha et al. 2016)]